MTNTRAGWLRPLAVMAVITMASLGSSARADLAVSAADLETFFSLPSETLTDLGNGPAVNGSGIWTSLLVQSGDVLSFNYNFLTNEVNDLGNTINDFAFLTVGQNVIQFADVVGLPLMSSMAPGFASETGYQTFNYTFDQAGSVLVGFGVVNVTDETFNSGLLLDNVMLRSALTTNGGFESGNLTGFNSIGDSSVVGTFGSMPIGQFQALLTTNSAVPEPSSLAMLGLGAAGLVARLRSRRKLRTAA